MKTTSQIQNQELGVESAQLSSTSKTEAKPMQTKAYQNADGSWTSEFNSGGMRSIQPGFATEQEALTDAGRRAAKLAKDNRLPIDRETRKANRTLPTPKVLNLLHTQLPAAYRLAEVVGKWVWVTFKEQPAAEIRQQLAQLGFHWNRERQAWQHPCGKFSLGSQADPHEKYSAYYPALVAPKFNGGGRIRRSTKPQTTAAHMGSRTSAAAA